MRTLRSKAPLSSLLNPQHPYVNAANTNLRLTFARVRREQAKTPAKVIKLRRKG